MGDPGTISVLAVGDVFPDVPDGRAALAPLRPVFAAADVAANKQREILVNLRNEAEHLTDLRVGWTTRLLTLQRRQRQLERWTQLGRR